MRFNISISKKKVKWNHEIIKMILSNKQIQLYSFMYFKYNHKRNANNNISEKLEFEGIYLYTPIVSKQK